MTFATVCGNTAWPSSLLSGGCACGRRGCTPYVFNGGGAPLPETLIFPSFAISQTTGNCVLM